VPRSRRYQAPLSGPGFQAEVKGGGPGARAPAAGCATHGRLRRPSLHPRMCSQSISKHSPNHDHGEHHQHPAPSTPPHTKTKKVSPEIGPFLCPLTRL
jgi:hypothetical protein